MAISAIRSYTPSKLNFNGRWETTYRQKYMGFYDGKIKTYIPSENETSKSIAIAWEHETGEYPIDWVRNNNPYNQSNAEIEYRIEGAPYMPIDILEASVKLKSGRIEDSPLDKIKMCTELAKLSAQKGDKPQTQRYETEMVDAFQRIQGAKYQEMAAFTMNKYKSNFGTEVQYRSYN